YLKPPRGSPLWLALACLGLTLVITVGAAVVYRKRPAILVGWAWFLVTLLPVIGLVQVGSQSVADRYTYLPHLGLFMALAWGVPDLKPRWRTAGAGALGALLALLGGLA